MAVELTGQQRAAVEERGGEILVSAAAGSGKTRILVERLLDRVEQEHIDLDRFLVITYTKAAASELRGKILDGLNSRLAASPEDAFLRRQRMVIYRAQISTIHSFCTALLREEGYRIDLEPDFRVADDTECAPLRAQVLERVLEGHYERLDDEPQFAALADTMGAGRDDRRLGEIVLSIFDHVQSHPDPEGWLRQQAAAFRQTDKRDAAQTRWGELLMEDARRQVMYWRGRFVEALDLLREDPVLEKAYSESFDATLDSMDDFLGALDRGWDSARALPVAFPNLGRAMGDYDRALKERITHMRKQCKERMNKLRQTFGESSETLLADLETVRPVVEGLHELVIDFSRAYEREKRRRNLADFSDLEHLALRLLVDGAGQPTEVARRWTQRFAEIMVDEYQDTNQVQNAIFFAVSDGGRHLFQVGDVKQSIYRFRLADPSIFIDKYHSFAPAGNTEDGAPRKIVLSYNFRSRASVLEGVNFLFENIMSTSFGELDYTADQRLYPRLPYPEHPDDRVELDVVDLAGLEQDGEEEKLRKDEIECDHVAYRIRQLLDSGFPVTEGQTLRPVRPEDIAILYRSPGGVMRRLTQALDRWRVPWSTDSGVDFFAQDEIETALAFLEIVDNPRQDVPLLAVLTSPIYHFTGSDLAELRAKCREGDLYDCLRAGVEREEEKCLRFWAELERLRALSVDRSGHRMLQTILEETGMRVVYGAMEGGRARQQNLRLLEDYARRFEQGGHRGLFGLVTQFRRMREAGQSLSAPGAESLGGVRIMSIHKSKGLEFPVVVLAGLSRKFNRVDQTQPVLFHSELGVGPKGLDTERRIEYTTLARMAVGMQMDREMKAEELRLLYVAMTRAREKLILVYATQDWAKQANKLAMDAGPRPDPEALSAMGCMGDWMLLPVLARPDAHVLRDGAGVKCPLMMPGDRWDIRLVPAVRPERSRRTKVERENAVQALETADLERLTWQYPHGALVNVPSKATATQLKGRELDDEVADGAAPQRTAFSFERPRFEASERGITAAQAGTAVHTVMQLIRLDQTGSVEQIRGEIERLTRLECLTPEMARAVRPERLLAFFTSPLGQAALHADDLRREFKFSLLESARRLDPVLPEEEQVLLQGVIDCCFTGPDGLTVVDFKTDRVKAGEEAKHAERYRTQLDVYTSALSRITGREVKRRFLWYFATGTAVELK